MSKDTQGLKESINSHGGFRPGSGRKKVLDNVVRPKPYIPTETHQFFLALGDGNFSKGLRRAQQAIQQALKLESDEDITLDRLIKILKLKGKPHGIE